MNQRINKCFQIGVLVGGSGFCHHDQSNRIYSVDYLCLTICTRYDNNMTGFKIAVYEQKTEPNFEETQEKY